MKNLVKILIQANTIEIENGLNWYKLARDELMKLAIKYNVNENLVYAVCSALSPRTTWQKNLNDTESVLKWYNNNGNVLNKKSYPTVTTYKQNLYKAIRILFSKNTDVFSTCKTFNFYHNIMAPDNEDYITIDGHMINAYYGRLGKVLNKHFTPKYYNRIAKQYIKLAKLCNIKPCQLQAIIWLAFKRINNIKVNWRDYQTNLPF